MKIIEYPHLQMTQAEHDAAVEIDTVILGYKDDIREYYERIEEYVKHEQAHRADLEKLISREVELRAELKVLDSSKREIRGKMEADLTRQRRCKIQIARTEVRIDSREKQIFKLEVGRRLRSIGKEVKLNRGPRAYMSSGPEVIDLIKTNEKIINEQVNG